MLACLTKNRFSCLRCLFGIRRGQILPPLARLKKAFAYFHETIVFYYCLYFPERLVMANGTGTRGRWLNKEVQISNQNLRDLYKLQRRYPHLVEKTAKRSHLKLVKDTKKNYFKEQIANSKNPNKTA
ncbi:hypothetical protein QE152_g23550 [Popillia japonica]|uniref:Uncharacterized protein n=1 Tax=Popillia japonica TaxID=7064 RepID=A0AAW1KEL0_POPJA